MREFFRIFIHSIGWFFNKNERTKWTKFEYKPVKVNKPSYHNLWWSRSSSSIMIIIYKLWMLYMHKRRRDVWLCSILNLHKNYSLNLILLEYKIWWFFCDIKIINFMRLVWSFSFYSYLVTLLLWFLEITFYAMLLKIHIIWEKWWFILL